MRQLNTAQREQLVDSVAEIMTAVEGQEGYFYAPNWEQASSYMGLVGLMGALEFPWAKPAHIEHTRMMIAHELLGLPQEDEPPNGTAKFLKRVRAVVREEVTEIRAAKGDPSKLSRPYQNALYDIEALDQRLITDPLILALRRSVSEIQQKRRS